MPVARLRASSSPDSMKLEGNDSLDAFTRQATGKEPFLSYSRAGDGPAQWIQLLHALDQQDLPGWPLLSPLKVQMQKCDKCSREFCSPINYRRHIRVHRRSLNFDKDSAKKRDLIGAFWDKLSLDEIKEIVSFNDVTLEEVSGPDIVKALMTFIRKPGFSFPQVHVKAGASLLDILQSRPHRFPISSHELFSILDDASERTFLLAGTANSMRKYVFDGEAGKIGLEVKNLVACTSFLVEQKLVKAWLVDKDAEALRCQKLLVEEEEASQRRKAELIEKRRKKKLRHKEQKAKVQTNTENTNLKEGVSDLVEDVLHFETSSPLSASDCDAHIPPTTQPDQVSEPIQILNTEEDANTGFCSREANLSTCQNVESRAISGSGRRHITRWQGLKSHRGVPNGFRGGQNVQVSKPRAMTKHGSHRDSRDALAVNGNKVWTRKPESEKNNGSLNSRGQKEAVNQADEKKPCEVLIGSIAVILGNCRGLQQGGSMGEVRDICVSDYPMPKKNNVHEKPIKAADTVQQSGVNRSKMKHWRPVSRQGSSGPAPVQSDDREVEVGMVSGKGSDISSESLRPCAMSSNNSSGRGKNGGGTPVPGVSCFSSRAAEVFLNQRWKVAIAGDHLKLVLVPESEVENVNVDKRSVLENAENRLANVGAPPESCSNSGTAKGKLRTKSDKSFKQKYIPRHRTIT